MSIKTRLPFHPRVARHRHKKKGLLNLSDATAMSVGAMIGGGIFSVLGVTVSLAGHFAAGCFIIGGVIALLTAHSFAVLSKHAGKSGGPFLYLYEAGHPKVGAFTSWLLIFGYVIAIAVYAFTFGHYAAHVLELSSLFARGFSILILAIFLAINLRGVAASALTEDTVVFIKVLVLVLISAIGIIHFSPGELTPVFNNGIMNVFLGAASIFVAYEGFELLSYDYDDIERPNKNLSRALYLSVGSVVLIYVLVTIGAQMLASDSVIISQKEVAFATVGQAALGTAGKWIATLGALLATCSAINATLFSTARQIHEISQANELPERFGKSHNGLPVNALIMLALFGGIFAMLPGVLELLTFGSAVFLAVFGLTNYLAFKISRKPYQKIITSLASLACLAAIIVLFIQLVKHDHGTLLLVAVCLLMVGTSRWLFTINRRNRAISQA